MSSSSWICRLVRAMASSWSPNYVPVEPFDPTCPSMRNAPGGVGTNETRSDPRRVHFMCASHGPRPIRFVQLRSRPASDETPAYWEQSHESLNLGGRPLPSAHVRGRGSSTVWIEAAVSYQSQTLLPRLSDSQPGRQLVQHLQGQIRAAVGHRRPTARKHRRLLPILSGQVCKFCAVLCASAKFDVRRRS